jgi:hypothetical protein
MMRATLVIAALSALTALPAAAGGEWPDGPNKQWFKGLQRPDNHRFPDRDLDSMTCCGPGDVVKTKFRVDLATSAYPRDVWYALLDNVWVRIPDDRIVSDHAPDGQAHLFVINVATEQDWGAPNHNAIICFVRPRGGL